MAISFTRTAMLGSSANSNVYSFNGVSVGAADASRKILIAVQSAGAVHYPTGITVDGNPATYIHQSSPGTYSHSVYIIDLPTGTTADIVVTLAGTLDRIGVHVFRLTNAAVVNYYDHGQSSTSSSTRSTSLDVPGGGIILGLTMPRAGGGQWFAGSAWREFATLTTSHTVQSGMSSTTVHFGNPTPTLDNVGQNGPIEGGGSAIAGGDVYALALEIAEALPSITVYYNFEYDLESNLFPLVEVPETPIVESWSWKTPVIVSRNGNEQRAALRLEPRNNLQLEFILLDDEDRRRFYRQLVKNSGTQIVVPQYQFAVRQTQPAEIGDTRLYFNPLYTNVRASDFVAMYHPGTEDLRLVRLSTLETDGANTASALQFDTLGYQLMPAMMMGLAGPGSISMSSISGTVSLSFLNLKQYALLRPGQDVELVTYDSLPVLHKRPLANESAGEGFDQGVEYVDNDTNNILMRAQFDIPFIGGTRQFLIHRYSEDFDYWREFGDTVRGSLKPFLLPSFRQDLTLASTPALSATAITVEGDFYQDMFEFDTYKRLQIETANGIIYRKVTSVAEDGDNTVLNLNTALGGSAGDNDLRVISFMNVARITDDQIVFQHEPMSSLLSMNVRTIFA